MPTVDSFRWSVEGMVYAYLSCSAMIMRIASNNNAEALESGKIAFDPIKHDVSDIALHHFNTFDLGSLDQHERAEFFLMVGSIVEHSARHRSILGKFERHFGRLDAHQCVVSCADTVRRKIGDAVVLWAGHRRTDLCGEVILEEEEGKVLREMAVCISRIYRLVRESTGAGYERNISIYYHIPYNSMVLTILNAYENARDYEKKIETHLSGRNAGRKIFGCTMRGSSSLHEMIQD
jgi:hypothetical protein